MVEYEPTQVQWSTLQCLENLNIWAHSQQAHMSYSLPLGKKKSLVCTWQRLSGSFDSWSRHKDLVPAMNQAQLVQPNRLRPQNHTVLLEDQVKTTAHSLWTIQSIRHVNLGKNVLPQPKFLTIKNVLLESQTQIPCGIAYSNWTRQFSMQVSESFNVPPICSVVHQPFTRRVLSPQPSANGLCGCKVTLRRLTAKWNCPISCFPLFSYY